MSLQTSRFSNDSLSADVIVIGSGPGGSVAGTMIAESGKSVLMLEEGSTCPSTLPRISLERRSFRSIVTPESILR